MKTAIRPPLAEDTVRRSTAAAPLQAGPSDTKTEIGFLKSVFAEITGKTPQRRRHCARPKTSSPIPPCPERPAGGSGTKLV